MRGDALARSARAFPSKSRGRWSSWSADVKRKRAQARVDKAVVVEQRAREERRVRSTGECVPGNVHLRRPWRAA